MILKLPRFISVISVKVKLPFPSVVRYCPADPSVTSKSKILSGRTGGFVIFSYSTEIVSNTKDPSPLAFKNCPLIPSCIPRSIKSVGINGLSIISNQFPVKLVTGPVGNVNVPVTVIFSTEQISDPVKSKQSVTGSSIILLLFSVSTTRGNRFAIF